MKPYNPFLLFVPLAFFACKEKPQEQKKPNILFIMTDDHTTQVISAYGGKLVKTPNIDRIANEGIRFDNCYATNALSGPSRACILTGKFGHINGFTDNAKTFDGSQETFPKLLQQNGYQTAIVGKWHLISEPQGFDFWSILSGQHEQGDYYNPDFIENGQLIQEQGYVTDIITDKAIHYIKDRDSSKPFALMVHHKAPHRNWMPAERHLGVFNDSVFPEPDNLFDDYKTRSMAPKEQDMSIAKTLTNYWDLKLATAKELEKEDFPDKRFKGVYARMPQPAKDKWNKVYAGRITEYRSQNMTGKDLVSWKYQQYMRDYLATTLAVDEGIGKILKYLEEIGELDNTIIIYTSDQGFFLGEHGFFDKRFMYEECQRMPLVMRYPKMIEAGSVTSAMSMNVDFAPTFLDIAGIDIPSEIQGRSLLSVLSHKGQTPEDWRESVYYHYFEYPAEHSVKRHYGIRTNRYKLIHFYNDIDEWEMYDLLNDPKEMNNLYDQPEYMKLQQKLTDILIHNRELYKDDINQ
ncbi:arylsulfatase A-like enzyme [Dysgonomonas hofstadii]|uniref:Arylsulfatase A-like enzyme n=1 Tax=Dysgonomonas hofstadii TaxID=637886 RepID=A0A840CQG3_9BACT|nr:sulfatase [Dysgonomonas hofstadii]MBB4037281.1 arylsulfatase A-like enzyme [Dysgonomonas hofstadii]